ncbi:GlxA family transcriptional regulator [Rhizobium leguminosarum]|jgi:transcriptional regulator GlxA family with amidase domain|uniref:GlxA family transcriptional regulator n=1 Tax=Rhizobium leguminosarum TaxID=384 RepID=A0A444HNY4_RHILE|nr:MULTISPECIES: GlxA family transcriptional regulator [Rhizobium]RWX24171.1 GlxA family transcriptional regulator [Rhizobium leguminosarum]TAU54616.1 GlxA family transcriptional regulator [Rhizobium leguminosarum]TBC95888.1 GlxA family transcriptional regulator [Rhizobium leguminosarum]TBD06346.1 GlxA family transcriptional regulator [Rhizobium leguminosarum]UIJ79089.1 GlxA family transcriptional regulator [Rhizobium leguminosarum]
MQQIGFLLYPGFQIMSLAAVSAFEFTNVELEEKAYEVRYLSEHGGPIANSLGMVMETEPFGDPAALDTLIVAGAPGIRLPNAAETDFVRAALPATRRLASICTGAFFLAEAGILDGRRATTHWYVSRELQSRYPKIKIEEDRIFIIDGSVWTSAGMTAGIDLALAMVEKDHGIEVARAVARMLVVYHRRSGGQSQFSALLELEPKSDRIQKALDFARGNLKSQLSVEELAEAAHLSPRQFSRAFRAETGQSPAKAVENLRLEAARLMMEQSRHPIDVVADETGFADRERMRRAFLRAFGQPPQAIRRNAQQELQR